MMFATSLPPRERNTAQRPQLLSSLVERVEKAMRPLSAKGCGPDHERVRELYRYFCTMSTGDALTRARRAVLYEILTPVINPNPQSHAEPLPPARFHVPDDETRADTQPGAEDWNVIW